MKALVIDPGVFVCSSFPLWLLFQTLYRMTTFQVDSTIPFTFSDLLIHLVMAEIPVINEEWYSFLSLETSGENFSVCLVFLIFIFVLLFKNKIALCIYRIYMNPTWGFSPVTMGGARKPHLRLKYQPGAGSRSGLASALGLGLMPELGCPLSQARVVHLVGEGARNGDMKRSCI